MELLKPRNLFTFAATAAALLWVAPVSAGLVRTLPTSHGLTQNAGTITVHQPKVSLHVRHSRGGTNTPPPPVGCTGDTTVSDPVLPPTQTSGHTRRTRSSDKSAPVIPTSQGVRQPRVTTSDTTIVSVTFATQKSGQRHTRSPRTPGPTGTPTPVGDPSTCPSGDGSGDPTPPLVIDVPTGDGSNGGTGPTINPTIIPAPEPASLLIFGAGVAGVAAYRRRKKRAA